MRLLLADDDRAFREELQRWLSKLGHEVLAARDGSEALAALASRPADAPVHCLITDWHMPEMTGAELCRAVRDEGHVRGGRELYVILLTGSGSTCEVDGLDAGADAYLPKPVDRADLLASLRVAERVIAMPR